MQTTNETSPNLCFARLGLELADFWVMSSNPAQILFVDDERPLLNALKRLFRSAGYRMHAADCGEDAIESSYRSLGLPAEVNGRAHENLRQEVSEKCL